MPLTLEHGRYLYHYTKAATLAMCIAPKLRLRMSPMAVVNDPRESKMWLPALSMGGGALPDDMAYEDFLVGFDDVMRQHTKVLCFTRDNPKMSADSPPDIYGWGYSHSRMWDHYGDKHQGVCVVLDIDTLGDEIATSLDGRGEILRHGVVYHNYPPQAGAFQMDTAEINRTGFTAAMKRHRELHHGVLYFYKAVDWASENEYRWVLFSEHEDEWEYVSVKQSLVGVIFGADCPADETWGVRWALRDQAGLRYGRMRFHNGHPIVLSEP